MKKKIPEFLAGMTIEQFCQYHHLGKSMIYQLKASQAVKVNNQNVQLDYVLRLNDLLEIAFSPVENLRYFEKPITILYEDDDMLIVNKPPFLLVHDDGNQTDDLTSRVNYYLRNQTSRALPVHRLDVEASGALLFSKHPLAHAYFNHLFESHQIEKKYQCLVEKKPTQTRIQASIGKDRHQNKQRVSKTGKDALTLISTIQEEQMGFRLNVEIITGRKHQIRLHLAHIGSPIIGDRLYGGKEASRLMLHCLEMSFSLFCRTERFTIHAPCPF